MKNPGRKVLLSSIILALWLAIMGVNVTGFDLQETLTATFPPQPGVISPTPTKAPMSPENLINLINRVRVSHGLRALTVDPILMMTAQTTADMMAGSLAQGHIGDVRGRIMAAGYGAGDIPWGTENFVVLPLGGESQILPAWADDTHQIPMVDPNYKHVGAGVAVNDETVYYVLHAAYTSNKIYQPGSTNPQTVMVKNVVSEYMSPVLTVTPRPDGKVIHIVKPGQTLWGIAIAYNSHINDILKANNLPQSLEMVYNGQELIIPIEITPQNTPLPPATATQMRVFTETPTRAPAVTQTMQSQTTLSPETQTAGTAGPVIENDQTKTIIQFGIGAGIGIGLVLIIVGVISNKKKSRE